MDAQGGGEKWKRIGRRELLDRGIFRAVELENLGPGGRHGFFTLLEAPDWASVLPLVFVEGRPHFLMVRQYRHGSDEVSVEFPGGVVEEGEEAEAAAARELQEETGWAAGRLRSAGWVYPNPAFMGNRFHVFVADRLEKIGGLALDEHEVVDSFLAPVEEIRAGMGRPPYSHALMSAALLLAERILDLPD